MSDYQISKRYQARVRKWYQLLAKRYDSDPVKRLGWRSPAEQNMRFQVLCDVGQLQNASLLDVGCGVGDLYGYLTQKGIHVNYTGCDLLPDHCAAAAQKYGDHFIAQDILEIPGEKEYDYVVASGVFGLLAEDWEGMVRATLMRMYSLCRIGIAANFLSIYTEPPEYAQAYVAESVPTSGIRIPTNFREIYQWPEKAGFYLVEPSTILQMCANITTVFKLRHDYAPRKSEFTIFAYR